MLFIHIGRGKSGSGTIQSLASTHVDFMEAHGVFCPKATARSVNHAPLVKAIRERARDRSALDRLLRDLDGTDKPHALVSSEFLIDSPRPDVERLKRALGDRPVKVICYLRDYPSWCASRYAQSIKKGRHGLDYDAFFDSRLETTSARERVENWGEIFGWEHMHLRTLQRADLHGADLVADFLHALGITEPGPKVSSQNLALPWWMLEFNRTYVATAEPGMFKRDPGLLALRPAQQLFEACLRTVEVPEKVQYNTPDQWRRAADLFAQDMAALGAKVGRTFPPLAEAPPPRPFLPTLEAVPVDVRRRFARKINKPDVARRLPADVLAVVKRMPGLEPALAAV